MVLNTNILQRSLVRKTRKATVETISEYITKGHIVMQTIFKTNYF